MKYCTITKGQIFKSITHNSGLTEIVIEILEVKYKIEFRKTITEPKNRKEIITVEALNIYEFNDLIESFSGIKSVKLARRVNVIVSGGMVNIGFDENREVVLGYREGFSNSVMAISHLDASRQANHIKHAQGRAVVMYDESTQLTEENFK